MANTPVRQYIGARYVPLFADPAEWDNTKTYEPLTIVLHEGDSYTSRQYVPIGIDITNTDYWALTGNYNAQVEAYRKTAQNALDKATTNETNINNINANLDALHANTVDDANTLYNKINKNYAIYAESIGCKAESGYDNATIINDYLKTHTNTTLIFSNGDYECQTPLNILNPGNIITYPNSYLVYTGEQTNTFITIKYSSDQNVPTPAQKYIIINADVRGHADIGVQINATRGINIYLYICNATGTGVYWSGSGHLAMLYVSPKNRYGQKDENISTEYGNIGLVIAGYDGLLTYIVTVDYNIGIQETGSTNHIIEAHPWGAAPNSIGIELNTSGTLLVDNFVEDSSVIAFNIIKGALTVKNITYSSTYKMQKLFVLGDSDATKTAAINMSECQFNQALLDDIAWTIGQVSSGTIISSNIGTMLHGKSGIDIQYNTPYLPGKYNVNKETVKDLTGLEATTFGQLNIISSSSFITYILYTEFGIYTNINKNYFNIPKTNWHKLG